MSNNFHNSHINWWALIYFIIPIHIEWTFLNFQHFPIPFNNIFMFSELWGWNKIFFSLFLRKSADFLSCFVWFLFNIQIIQFLDGFMIRFLFFLSETSFQMWNLFDWVEGKMKVNNFLCALRGRCARDEKIS